MTLGVNAKIGYKKASAWSTAVAPTTDDRMPFIRSTIDPRRGMLPDESLLGAATRNPDQRGDLDVQGVVEIHADYRQWGLFLAQLLANETNTEIEAAVTHQHACLFQASSAGKFGTFGQDDGVEAFLLASAKPTRYQFVSEQGGGARETLAWIMGGLDEDSISSAGWTYLKDPSETGARIIKHRQGVFRCNAAAGGALGSGDVLYPTRFELVIDRFLHNQPGLNDNVEPMPEGSAWADIRVTLDFDEYSAAHHALFYDAMVAGEAGTLLKADYLFTGPEVAAGGAADAFQRNHYWPALRVIEAPREIPGPGKLPARVVMTAHKAAALPTGFPTGYLTEVAIEMQNDVIANYL